MKKRNLLDIVQSESADLIGGIVPVSNAHLMLGIRLPLSVASRTSCCILVSMVWVKSLSGRSVMSVLSLASSGQRSGCWNSALDCTICIPGT